MVGMRSDRTRARARDVLARYPVPEDADRLRELAIDYVREADRLETQSKGRPVQSDEVLSSALDAIARDYFARSIARATPQRKR
jgi:hypothetical protein